MITFSKLGKLGRLGNQLFQIASSIGVATHNNEEYYFPQWNYNQFMKKSIPCGNIHYSAVYNETGFRYQDIAVKDCDLHGYFQSPKYFRHCDALIRSYFQLKDEYTGYLENKYGHFLKNTVCSIHVRRGDYLSRPDYHPFTGMDYYTKAMKQFPGGTTFLVFSDDMEWCRQNFHGDNFVFPEREEDILELFLMSRCHHHIIANSSFSWWGAYLDNRSSSIVIAPAVWFGKAAGLDTADLYMDHWIKI